MRLSYRLLVVAGLVWNSAALATTWRWSNPLPNGNNIVDMACLNGLAVQVGDRGQLYTSYDMNNWVPRDSHTTNFLQAVTFFGNRIVVTGENGAALHSDNGADFIYTNLLTSDWLVSVAASPALLVAVGDNAAIWTSSDGAYWKPQRKPRGDTDGSKWLLGVAWGAGTFVAVGESGYIAICTNAYGTNWFQRTVTTSPAFTDDINRVSWVNTLANSNGFPVSGFWAVATSGKVIASTDNGATWVPVSMTGVNSTNTLYAVTGNDSSRLVVGDQSVHLQTSVSNLTFWTSQTPQAPAWAYYTAMWITNDPSFYWLAGQSGMQVEGAWTNGHYAWKTPFFSPRDWLWQVTTAQGLYIAVGDHARVLTSNNGMDWSIEAMPITNSVSSSNTVFFGVGGTTNLLIAVGSQGSVALSPNNYLPVVVTNLDGSWQTNYISTLGLGWYPMPAPTTNDLHGVGFFRGKYYLSGGNGTVLSSPDGTNWTPVPVPTTAYLSSIETYTNGLLVLVGDQGTILTSPNGVTWTANSVGTNWIYRVRCLSNSLVAVGENGTILLSNDGVYWTPGTQATTEWLNDVQWVANQCFIVGTSGAMLWSTNLTNWTYTGTITEKSMYGAATQNGQLVVVGIEGAILRSQIVPDLNPIRFLSYIRSSGVNVFLVGGDPDQSFTLDFSYDLVNWTTGPRLDILNSTGTLLFIQNTGTNAPSPTFYRATLVPQN